MPTLYTYIVRRLARDERGRFTKQKHVETLAQRPRKLVEFLARAESRKHPRHLVTLERDDVVIARLVCGRVVDAQAVGI